jgi:hypothetical protein
MAEFKFSYRSNIVLVGFNTPHGKRWISTGERSIDAARAQNHETKEGM